MAEDGKKYSNLIMKELKLPSTHSSPEAMSSYAKFGRRIHWVDGNNMPGSFQMNTSWWFGPTRPPENREGDAAKKPAGGAGSAHTHPYQEILGFYGSDPQNPYDLGGEVELWIDGEQHIITESCMVFLPPNLPHCPLKVNRVDRPIFHFSVVMNSEYTSERPGAETFVAK